MQRLKLIFPILELEQEALEYRQEHIECGEQHIHGSGGLLKASGYKSWLARSCSGEVS